MRAAKCLLLLLIFFLAATVTAQDDKSLPLKQIINHISEKYGVKFSFIEDEIVLYSLPPPEEGWTLKETIAYLESQTKLKVQQSSKKLYIIYNDSRLDKPLCGYLTDAESGLPIENAAVSIFSAGLNTSSDTNGYFELPKISPDSISVKHQGYEKISISPKDLYTGNCQTFSLKPVTAALEEVSAQRIIATGISKGRSGSFKMKPSHFGILPGLTEPDVLQTMQQIPGVYSADETISNINVRGGTHDQNLFLWNGIKMYQTGHFFGLISSFNPSLGQSITIIKNGASAFFGESVSSVVDISSHATQGSQNKYSIGTNLINAEAYALLNLSKNASIILSGRKSHTEFFDSPTYVNYRNRVFQNTVVTNFGEGNNNVDTIEDFGFYDFTAQYRQKIGNNTLNLDLIGISNFLDVSQMRSGAVTNSSLDQQTFGANLSFSIAWNERTASTASIFVSDYALRGEGNSVFSGQNLNQENAIVDIGTAIRLDHKLTTNFLISAGYQYDERGVKSFDQINIPEFERTVTEVLRSHILAAESTFEPTSKKLFLKAGLRLNYFEKFSKFLAEPRLSLNYRFSENWQCEFLGERKSQTLSQIIDRQQDFLGIEKRRWILADDENVPVQTSTQASIGLTYKSSGWLITIDNFYKFVDGITTGSQGFQNQFELISTTGSYRVFGSEVLLQRQINRFTTWLSYTYNNNVYRFEQLIPSEFDNNYDVPHSIACAAIYEKNNLKVAAGLKWHSGRPYTPASADSENEIAFGNPNSERLPAYFQSNLSASKKWKLTEKIHFEAGLSILNLFNRRNVINRFYSADDGGNLQQIDTYSLELTPNANVKLTF